MVRKYARQSGILSFSKIPNKVVFEAISEGQQTYNKGYEENFILLIVKTCLKKHFNINC